MRVHKIEESSNSTIKTYLQTVKAWLEQLLWRILLSKSESPLGSQPMTGRLYQKLPPNSNGPKVHTIGSASRLRCQPKLKPRIWLQYSVFGIRSTDKSSGITTPERTTLTNSHQKGLWHLRECLTIVTLKVAYQSDTNLRLPGFPSHCRDTRYRWSC